MQAQSTRLKVKELAGQGIALLRKTAQCEHPLRHTARRCRQRMVGVRGELGAEQVRQARQGRVNFDAAPGPATAARIARHVELLERSGHVASFHAGQRRAGKRQAVGADVGAAQTGARRQQQHGAGARAPQPLRLGHSAQVAVVTDGQRHRAAGSLGQCRTVGGIHVKADEAFRQVGGAVEHAVALERAGDRQADALDLVPRQVMLIEIVMERRDPTAHNRGRTFPGIGWLLEQSGGDGRTVAPDRADLGGRGAAVSAEKDVLSSGHALTCLAATSGTGRWRVGGQQNRRAAQLTPRDAFTPSAKPLRHQPAPSPTAHAPHLATRFM